jgi:TP901 family phage tail tape measure protein
MADKNIKLVIEAILKDKGFQKGVKGMGTQMKKTSVIAGGFSKVLGALGLAGGIYALVGVMKSAIKTQMQFEQSVANVASVSGDSNKAIAELARRMGKDTVFSAKEAADSMYFLASSGMKVSQMSEVLAPTLDLAAAAQMGIAEATDIVVNNLKVFATEGIKAQEVVDIMAQTVRSSNTNMQQMGEAMKYAGSEMSLAGVKFQDIALTIGAMADMGHKGSEAGAKLRMVYARLGGDIPAVSKALKEFGTSQDEINKLLPTPIKLFERLKRANDKLNDPIKANALATKIFGVRNKAVFKLIKDGLPNVEKLRKALKDTGGVAKEMAEKQLDTLQGQLKMLKSATDEIVLSLMGSSGMAVGLKDVTKELVNQIRTIGDWINSAVGIQAIEIAIKALGVAFKLVYATAIQPVFEFMFVLIKATVEAFIGLGKTMSLVLRGEWKKAVIEANSALDDMKNTAVYSVKRIGNTWKGMGKDLAYMWKATTKDYTKEANDRVSAGAKETEDLGKGYKKGTKGYKKAEKEKTRIAKEESKKRKKLLNEYNEYILSDMAKRVKANEEMNKKISGSKRMMESYSEYVKFQKKRKESIMDLATFALKISKQNIAEKNKLEKEANDKYGMTLEMATNMTKIEAEDRAKVWSEYLKKYGKQEEKTVKKSKSLWEGMSKQQKDAFESISTIVGKIGDEIGGEMGQAVNAVGDFVGALLKAGTDPMAIMTTLIVAAISFIVNEFNKAQRHMELMENLRIENMEKVRLEEENQNIARLEREKARIMKRYNLEAHNYANMNQVTRDYYNLLKKQEEKRYAEMDEGEKREYDLKKKYDEEKRKAEEAMDEKIKQAKMRRFKVEQKIAVAKARIARTEANAEINKNFPMPWDAERRQEAKDAMNKQYDKMISLIKSQQPSFQKGIESVPKTGEALVHARERIIPASMNVPNISNSDFVEAAMAGIPMIRSGANYSTTNNDNANNSRNITIQNVTLPNVTNTKEMLLEMQEIADSMGTSLLNV